jgi:hypothetical protein
MAFRRWRADLHRRHQVDVCAHRQLEHELAALALADLEEGPLLGCADLVALGVDQDDVGGLAGDLAAQDEGRRPVGARRDQGVAVALCAVAR